MEERETPGNRLLDYSIIRPVGKGSYGEVSLARHRGEGRQFVIKKLSLQNAPRRERRAAQQEAQLLSRLRHPNIVTYRESWEGDDGFLYIVMGYCEGGDLYHRLKEQKGRPLPEERVVDWFVQIAMALQYLHDERIMHRDLKTQNIFLTRSDIIKVGDLGIARVLESQYDMASTLIGTPYYMSPELFSNKPYNYKSDVWALGCCVYEMATLKHAFNAKDMNSLVYRIIEGKLPPMPLEYSADLGELIATMLSRHPEKRPTVRQILRKPFIKHHISLFLQATKLRGKRRKKVPETPAPRPSAAHDPVRKPKPMEVKSSPMSPEPGVLERCMSSGAVSISTLSKVDIDIPSPEKKSLSSGHSICAGEPGNGGAAEVAHLLAGGKKMTEPAPSSSMEGAGDTAGALQPQRRGDCQFNPVGSESTAKRLEPFLPATKHDGLSNKAEGVEFGKALRPHTSESGPSLSRQRRHRERTSTDQSDVTFQKPLPSPPSTIPQNVKKSQDCSESASSGNPSQSHQKLVFPDHRPLSARERRRLKQSQEEIFTSEPSVNRPPVARECIQTADAGPVAEKEAASCCVSEDERSSSASSTEKSEGDGKDRKSDSNEMQDLVQLMTRTLQMEKEQKPQIPPNEFRLHRKYRDTLILHGKSAGDPEAICFQDIPPDHLSAPEKFRRMIEALRADVVQGLGVKLLEEVYDIMEEEDELKREVCLQNRMGEKYSAYSQKVYQLKFFEENSKF